jgi:hypothetical protein
LGVTAAYLQLDFSRFAHRILACGIEGEQCQRSRWTLLFTPHHPIIKNKYLRGAYNFSEPAYSALKSTVDPRPGRVLENFLKLWDSLVGSSLVRKKS